MSVQTETNNQADTVSEGQPDSDVSVEPILIPPLVADNTQTEMPEPDTEPESAISADDCPVLTDPGSDVPANDGTEQTDTIPLIPEEDESPNTESEPEQSVGEEPPPAEPGNENTAPEEPEPAESDSPAWNPPAAEHEASHHVEERVHGRAVYQPAENLKMHNVITQYDLYCTECQRVIVENYRIEQYGEPHSWMYECEEPTCSQEGVVHFTCSLCGLAYDETLPCLEHMWSEWEDRTDYCLPECVREQVMVHRCVNCGREETVRVPAQGHQWEAVSYTEATCTSDGAAVRRCRLCGIEDTIVLPAFGHSFVQLDSQNSQGKSVCAICGLTKDTPQVQGPNSHMYYNNTVTSFGPTTRELIGGSVWNRVTPVDLSKEGVFTYPLIASNMYTVGTATLINSQEGQQVVYRLSSSKVNVHSESLVVYPNLEALRTGEDARFFDFNVPIDLKACFGEDAHVIIAITLKADYDADSAGVTRFLADQRWIDQMMEMIK